MEEGQKVQINKLELGAIIRKRRKELGLTLNDLAGDNISVPTLSNIERGVIGNVSDDKMEYIKDRLGLKDEEIAKLASKADDEQREIKRRLSSVHLLIQLKRFESARKEIRHLEKESDINNLPYFVAVLQLCKGILYRHLKQWQRAKNSLEKAIRLARELNFTENMNTVAEAYFYLSICAFYGDQDYEQALEHIDSAFDAFQEGGGKPHFKGKILFYKALYYFHLERYGPAMKFVLESLEESRRNHDMRLLIYEHNIEALIYKRQQLYNDAARAFEKAIAVAENYYPEPAEASLLYLNLGDMHYQMKQYDRALHYYDISMDLTEQTKDQDMFAVLYQSYGEVYYETGEYEKAVEYIDKACALNKQYRLTSVYLYLFLLKGQVALSQGSEEVPVICQEGIRLAEKSNLHNKVKEFHIILAKYYGKKGNQDKYLQETERVFQAECLLKKTAVKVK